MISLSHTVTSMLSATRSFQFAEERAEVPSAHRSQTSRAASTTNSSHQHQMGEVLESGQKTMHPAEKEPKSGRVPSCRLGLALA